MPNDYLYTDFWDSQDPGGLQQVGNGLRRTTLGCDVSR